MPQAELSLDSSMRELTLGGWGHGMTRLLGQRFWICWGVNEHGGGVWIGGHGVTLLLCHGVWFHKGVNVHGGGERFGLCCGGT